MVKALIYMGKHTYAANKPTVLAWGNNFKVTIGNFCSIGGMLKIFLGGNHPTDWVTTFPFGHVSKDVFDICKGQGMPTSKGDVTIGNDVWIGDDVTIESGVVIGDGAIIAMRSLVTKSVAPYCIVGGNPAKLIRQRFDDSTVERLLQIRWWDWHDDKINRFSPYLCANDIEKFIEMAKGDCDD
jgi:acetyltransferase-like isoleucine patch superfamily enzyme